MASLPYTEIDVFTAVPLKGNALAVVLDASGLREETMLAFARWTNLSETTFLLPPTNGAADYRVRIFTPSGELPFAGHPTLGSCHAWLAAGGKPRLADEIVQECAVGLVRVRRDGARLAFAAPPRRRAGPVDEATVDQIAQSLRVPREAIRAAQWADNGPGWVAVLLGSRDELLALEPNLHALSPGKIGVVAPCPPERGADFELRAFVGGSHPLEDPVTGSLNASVAQWLIGAGVAPDRYVAAQGTVLGRDGRVYIERRASDIWVGGHCVSLVTGRVYLES
jgi:PhzF family phenazine biosynthesis protein